MGQTKIETWRADAHLLVWGDGPPLENYKNKFSYVKINFFFKFYNGFSSGTSSTKKPIKIMKSTKKKSRNQPKNQ